jgi:hypothetical protein
MYRKLFIVVLALVLAVGIAQAQTGKPDATISIDVRSVGLVLGASMGRGVVTYGPKTYAFKVQGLTVLTVGIKDLEAKGDVFQLKSIDDLAGTYKKMDKAGLTFIKTEEMGLVVKNEKGVVLNLKAVKSGLELDLVSEGLKIVKVK